MDVAAYLARIGFEGSPVVDLRTLERLQRAHLTAIPFENLHVYSGREMSNDVSRSIPKLVDQRRGGWCYELNGAFAALLDSLRFEARLVGAFVLEDPLAPQEDHMAIEVRLDRSYLVDVGFGDTFIRPLPLDDPGPHDGGTGMFGFEFGDGWTTLVQYADGGSPEPQYRFSSRTFTTSDFDTSATYLRTNPALSWRKSRFVTRLLDGGPDRVTLLEQTLRVTHDGASEERAIGPDEWADVLMEWFGLTP